LFGLERFPVEAGQAEVFDPLQRVELSETENAFRRRIENQESMLVVDHHEALGHPFDDLAQHVRFAARPEFGRMGLTLDVGVLMHRLTLRPGNTLSTYPCLDFGSPRPSLRII
jgi:hypothetical protein